MCSLESAITYLKMKIGKVVYRKKITVIYSHLSTCNHYFNFIHVPQYAKRGAFPVLMNVSIVLDFYKLPTP